MSFSNFFKRTLGGLGALLFLMATGLPAFAGEMKLEARLIWGTNTDTNSNTRVQDQRLTKALSGIFKWKNYYEITNRTATIAQDATCSLEMSSKALLKIKNLDGTRIEVSCIGEGKSVTKTVHSLPSGEWLTLGGNVQNDSAWFIVIKSTAP